MKINWSFIADDLGLSSGKKVSKSGSDCPILGTLEKRAPAVSFPFASPAFDSLFLIELEILGVFNRVSESQVTVSQRNFDAPLPPPDG
jgi:hypothetical protein